MKHYLNVCEVDGAAIAPVDIITFGSPCQDLSVAGKQSGMKHKDLGDGETTRSGLFMEAVRIIKEMREKTNGMQPTYALWENVPGAFSSEKGEDFRAVLEEISKIKGGNTVIPRPPKGKWADAGSIMADGWSVAWRVLDAQFHGVPQRRRRILLVADFTGQRAGEILFDCRGLSGYPAASSEARQGASGDARNCLEPDDSAVCLTPEESQFRRIWAADGVSPTLGSSDGGGGPGGLFLVPDVAHCIKGKGCLDHREDSDTLICMATQQGGAEIRTDNKAPCLTAPAGMSGNNQPVICIPINDKATRYKGGGDTRKGDGSGNGLGVGQPGDPSPTLTVGDRHVVCCAAFSAGQSSEAGSIAYHEEVAPTLRGGASGTNQTPTIVTAFGRFCKAIRYIVRRLTPTECARLQGFPDWWGDIPTIASMSDEDYAFWGDVLKSKATIEDKPYKAKTREQMVTWYNKLHNDGAEYKMWGNGVALPAVRVPLHGMAQRGAKTLGSLFDGSGGFPLAGLLDGITPLWASEIEPYPIAVTKYQFSRILEGKEESCV